MSDNIVTETLGYWREIRRLGTAQREYLRREQRDALGALRSGQISESGYYRRLWEIDLAVGLSDLRAPMERP